MGLLCAVDCRDTWDGRVEEMYLNMSLHFLRPTNRPTDRPTKGDEKGERTGEAGRCD